MFTTDLVNLYNMNIFKTSLYIYIFHNEKCRLAQSIFIYVKMTKMFKISYCTKIYTEEATRSQSCVINFEKI